ncbi:hypothetical protein ZWY2020_001809 [Hordeum vulgare]|nr:hypothetical protein ZWY2020_001809 [Hordeum vulgare]
MVASSIATAVGVAAQALTAADTTARLALVLPSFPVGDRRRGPPSRGAGRQRTGATQQQSSFDRLAAARSDGPRRDGDGPGDASRPLPAGSRCSVRLRRCCALITTREEGK